VGYITREPKEDTRSVLGRRVDQLCGLFLIWLASFLLLVSLTGRLVIAFILSVPLLVLEAVVLQKILITIEQKRQQRRRFWLAGKKLFEDISKMDSLNEFKLFVRGIIAGLPGFQTVRFIMSKENESGSDVQCIDLEGVYQGIPVAILCARPERDKKITPFDIRSFASALSLGGYKNGLFVTTGEYGPGVARVIKEFSRKGINIKLINRYGLMNLALRTGFGVFNEEGTVPEISSLTAGERRAAVITAFWDSVFSYGKAKSYFLFGLLLYGGYVLMRGTTFLSLFYLSFALLNILMGTACLYFGRSVGEADPLKGLGPDKQ